MLRLVVYVSVSVSLLSNIGVSSLFLSHSFLHRAGQCECLPAVWGRQRQSAAVPAESQHRAEVKQNECIIVEMDRVEKKRGKKRAKREKENLFFFNFFCMCVFFIVI